MEALRHVGDYDIQDTLGKGGMGVVYLAQHTQTQERVALKTVRVPSRSLIAGIRREIRALAQLDHPGIITVVAHGVHEGIPWYAMPYVEGISLTQVLSGEHTPTTLFERSIARHTDVERLHHTQVEQARRTSVEQARRTSVEQARHTSVEEDAPIPKRHTAVEPAVLEPVASLEDAPEPDAMEVTPPKKRRRGLEDSRVHEALFLLTHLCDALAYLHGEGIVHRDLKPSNVLVQENGVVLVDFGLALRGGSGRALITKAFALGGTAAYMSPEQIDDAWLDARSDLYALGCMLYEALTGRPPFMHETPAKLLAMHQDLEPVPPSVYADGIPDELQELTLRLLAKRPEDRPGHVADVAAQLRDVLGLETPADLGSTTRAFLYHPVLTERDTERAILESAFGQTREGCGCTVLLGGESGVGKTRLAVELIRHVKRERGEVLTGFCVAEEGQHRPFYPLEEVVEELIDVFRDKDPLIPLLYDEGAVLTRFFPALRALPGMGEGEIEPPTERVYDALTRLLIALARHKPLLVVLDDIHWADPLTLGWLLWCVEQRHLEQARVMLLATFRSDEQQHVLRALVQHPDVVLQSLSPLGESGLATMTRSMLGLGQTPRNLVRFLARQTGGNPFFVAEYLRAAVATGLFFRDRLGRWQVLYESDDDATVENYEELPLPGALRQLVVRRTTDLGPVELRVLGAASVLGRSSQRELLAPVSGFDSASDDAFLDAIAELHTHRLLEESEERGAVRFINETLREVVYERLPDDERRVFHRRAATCWVERGGRPSVIAFHKKRSQAPISA